MEQHDFPWRGKPDPLKDPTVVPVHEDGTCCDQSWLQLPEDSGCTCMCHDDVAT